ncbi:hypothetical protein VXS06_14670 [Photobacterium toruni]|uniref:Uncharacterized protein n=1 Tax=Photobacterium toruni TaxID=1935446 RepID=A0ABU6LCI1_9GAMM|nr:hypothetical protein [Photobacterium toruni]
MKRNRFYLVSPHSNVGSNVSFHAIDGNGYTTDLDKCHTFTHAEIQKKVDDGHIRHSNQQGIPLSADHVDELAVWHVDMQYLNPDDDSYPTKTDINDEYVVVNKNTGYDGNDVAFVGPFIGPSFDYSRRSIFSGNDINNLRNDGDLDSRHIVYPKSLTDRIARRTFQERNINRRKMIQGAGIIGVRKPRELSRPTSGKTRWNCPTCGKINWQYNPYDFDGCSDRFCESN